jgi:hypothetical protein
MANKHRKVWKVVSRKLFFGKQTWPKPRPKPKPKDPWPKPELSQASTHVA